MQTVSSWGYLNSAPSEAEPSPVAAALETVYRATDAINGETALTAFEASLLELKIPCDQPKFRRAPGRKLFRFMHFIRMAPADLERYHKGNNLKMPNSSGHTRKSYRPSRLRLIGSRSITAVRLPCIRISIHLANNRGDPPARKSRAAALLKYRPAASPQSRAPERRPLHCCQYLFHVSFKSFFFSSAASAFHWARHFFSRASIAALASFAIGA